MLGRDKYRGYELSVVPGCTGETATCTRVVVYLVSSFGTSAAASS